MDPSFGQHVIMDHQRKLRRAEARERLSVEEQAAWGLLDDQAAPVSLGRRRSRIRLQTAWARAFAYVRGRRKDSVRCMIGAAATRETGETRRAASRR